MSLPTQADLLGFEWGFAGDPFVVAAAKSTLDPGTPEWNFGGVPLLFNLSSGDPAADRAVTALNAMVLAGNPSAADALVTVIRSMIVRSSSAPDADRSITKVSAQALMGNPSTADAIVTVLRKMVLRTQDDPSADRRVTNLIAKILRATRRGDVARPSGQGRLVFNDFTVTPGEGEYAIGGYYGVASRYSGWTGLAYLGDQFAGNGYFATMSNGIEPSVGPSKVPFTIGEGMGGDVSALIRKWHEGLTQRGEGGFIKPLQSATFLPVDDLRDYPYPISSVAEVDDSTDVNGHSPGGDGNFPVGMSAGPLTWATFGIATYPFFYSKINADFSLHPGVMGLDVIQPYPDAAASQWALPAFTVYNHMAVTFGAEYLNGSGDSPYTFRQVVAANYDFGSYGGGNDRELVCPKLTLARTMGRGAWRIAPNSYRDWNIYQDGLPALRFPSQGANDPLEEMYGVTYGSEKALWEALVANPDLSPMNLDWPAPDNLTFYKANGPTNLYNWWAVIPHRWGPAVVLVYDSEAQAFRRSFKTFDDGQYVTKDGELRYSRYKTLLMHQHLAYDREADLGPEGAVDPFEINRVIRGYAYAEYTEGASAPDLTKGRRMNIPNIAWDADDFDTTIYDGTAQPPCFFVEKLDSPSTHFNDPPGTPGVDDL